MKRLALVYSDLQATEGDERLRANPAIPLQRWRVQRFYADLAQLYREHDCRYLIDLGDTTDDRKALPVPTINAVMSGLSAIRPSPLLSIKLIGNHEQAYRDAGQHPGVAYEQFHRVVADREVIVTEHTVIICMAWQEDADEAASWLNEALDRARCYGRKILVLGHLQADGARLAGKEMAGMTAMWDVADVALLGHVHLPQTLGVVQYVGSPFQQDYGEMGQVKRVGLLDLDTLALEWLALPSDYPRYLRLSMDELEAYGSLGEDRVTVTLRTPDEAARFHAHPLSTLCDPDYQLTVTGVSEPMTPISVTPYSVLRDYVDKRPLAGFSAEELLAEGREVTGL